VRLSISFKVIKIISKSNKTIRSEKYDGAILNSSGLIDRLKLCHFPVFARGMVNWSKLLVKKTNVECRTTGEPVKQQLKTSDYV
jgi:hypothetical protein